jgi:ubiquinone/menaquinone biosynthesis C-methylase UbiE
MKKILDVACGGKMFYFDKNDPRVLFCDNREIETTLCDGRHFTVKPDVKCDFTELPFADNVFRMVVFDPPHLLRNTGESKFAAMYGSLKEKAAPTGYQMIKYGALYSDWRDMLHKGFAECLRVLEPYGFLIFKWNETDIVVNEVLKLAPCSPIFGHRVGKLNKTHWLCFMKAGGEL